MGRLLQPADSKMTDAELARRIAGGDQDAIRLLMQRYDQLLYRTARSIVKDAAEAEDALQAAYVLSLRAIGKFRGDAKLATWLVRIVINESIAHTRKLDRIAGFIRFESAMDPDNEAEEAGRSESPIEQPEQTAMRTEARRLLETKIDELPEALRTVFVLRAVEEMPVEEVAAALNISNAAVRTRFFRAKYRLRKILMGDADVTFKDVFTFAGARCVRMVALVLAQLDVGRESARS